MKLTNDFSCNELNAVLSYEVCFRRQSVMMLENSKSRNPRYAVCHYCDEGKKIMAKFPEWKYEKKVHRGRRDKNSIKPDRIFLHKKSGSRAACLKAIDLKPDKRAEMIPKRPIGLRNQEYNAEKHSSAPIIPFNAKLFVQAQKGYIETLVKQGKTVEAKERIDMVINELSVRGLNYREFEGKT